MSEDNPQRLSLAPDQIGDVAMALLTLSHEVWAVQDRVRMLEAILETHGINAHTEIERFVPDANLAAEQAKKANAFVARIIAALVGQAPQNPPELS